jgi:hypothetical protein
MLQRCAASRLFDLFALAHLRQQHSGAEIRGGGGRQPLGSAKRELFRRNSTARDDALGPEQYFRRKITAA